MKNKQRRKLIQLMGLSISLPLVSFALSNNFNDEICNKKKKKKILIAYASEYGSTVGVAKMIGKTLCSFDVRVDVKYIEHINNIEGYEQVIIGSPIQYDTWMDEAKTFVQTYKQELSVLNVSYFFTCLTLSQKSEKAIKQAQVYADDLELLCPEIKLQSIGQFAGVLNFSKFPFSFRLLARVMFKVLGVKEGDYRDWDAIKKWSNKIKIKG